jgi:hypothetical protein
LEGESPDFSRLLHDDTDAGPPADGALGFVFADLV